jgi:hypothetical protein
MDVSVGAKHSRPHDGEVVFAMALQNFPTNMVTLPTYIKLFIICQAIIDVQYLLLDVFKCTARLFYLVATLANSGIKCVQICQKSLHVCI